MYLKNMNIETRKSTRIVSLLLAMIMLLSLCFSTIISSNMLTAKAESITFSMKSYPLSQDSAKYDSSKWKHNTVTFWTGHTKYAGTGIDFFHGASQMAYCLEPGVQYPGGTASTRKGENYFSTWASTHRVSTIDQDTMEQHLGRILTYGFGNDGRTPGWWVSQQEAGRNCIGWALATQLLIWETVVGERDANFNHVNPPSAYNKVLDFLRTDFCCYSETMSNYNDMVNKVKNHAARPSFMSVSAATAQTIPLTYDGSKYVATLQDTNGVLSNYSFSGSGLSFSKSGNTLTISATTPPTGTVTISASKANAKKRGILIWTSGDAQDICQHGDEIADPVPAYLKAEVIGGNIKLVKTAEDNNVSGISFNVSGNGINRTITTGSDGTITAEGFIPGTYTVTEIENAKYVKPESQTVTVVAGQTATVTFNNTLKRGSLKVTKSSEDGFTEGIRFHLYGTATCGLRVDEYATTNASGVATFSNVLVGSNYSLEEVDTPSKYVIPSVSTVGVTYNTTTNQTVINKLKKFAVKVTKQDKEKTIAQGNATLIGAVYGVYKGDELKDTYTIGSDGTFTTKEYVCGNDWSIREITPSTGYLLDSTSYHIGSESGNFTIEHNSLAMTVKEMAIKAPISILKHIDKGDTIIENPEEGAEFSIYLKSAGSYNDAKDYERDYLTTDANGLAKSKDLPYGTYVVTQEKGKEGAEIIEPFEVFINQNAATYHYTINDRPIESYVKIVKVDAESGEKIALSGAGFKIRNSNNEFVSQQVNCPTQYVTDVFYTTTDGTLMLPEKLLYGEYELIEVQAPYGYVLDSTPVKFKVTNSSQTVEVVKADSAQKGQIKVAKSGEVFAAVNQSGTIYQPTYEVQGIKGAVYQITAAEDIVTADGTVHYTKNQVVDTVTTGNNGVGTSKSLYLGKYNVKEIQAPYGMLIDNEIHGVELTYADQEVEVTSTNASVSDDRETLVFSLNKELEQDMTFGIGDKNEIQNVSFGLYAKENITASNGQTIPKDGLIEVLSCDANGNITFKSDLPFGKYYIKEVATDEHYVLPTTQYSFEFAYQGETVNVVNIIANNGHSIPNEIIRGNVNGKKYDEDGNVIQGAVFGLFKQDETTFTADTALKTSTSDANGSFGFDDIPYGQWIVCEITPAEGYVRNETLFPVRISQNNETVNVQLTNRFIVGTVKTTKIDEMYPENKLSGATFEVYKDVNKNGAFDEDVDTFIGNLQEVEKGIYTLENLRYGQYLLYETVAPEGYIRDFEYYPFAIVEDGKTVEVENNAGVGFMNKPTEVHITKTDITSANPVEGAQVSIYWIPDFVDVEKYITPIVAEDGSVSYMDASSLIANDSLAIFAGYTEENGVMNAFTLPFGKYVFRETVIPDGDFGYKLNEEAYVFILNEDGSITGCTSFTDESTSVVISKKDLTTEESLPGAEIAIYSESGVELFRDTTDENGEISLFYLPRGTYYFKEIIAPNGYLINETVFKFVINEKGIQVGDSVITDKPTEVTITKTDLTTAKPVAGAEITIYDSDGEEVFKDVTKEDGTITAFKLPVGNYTFKETIAPVGYKPNSNTFEFTILQSGRVDGTVDFTDEPVSVTITKSDVTTSEPVAGAEITIYDSEGEEVFKDVTKEDGTITAFRLPAGDYTFKETVAPDGYSINETVFKFTVNEDGSVTGDNTVTDKQTEVVLKKTDLTTSEGVSGAEITIYDKTGKIVYHDITDNHGEIKAFKLPVGTYTFKETNAPEGYLINEATFTFTIHEDGSVTGDNTVSDERIQGAISVKKVDSVDESFALKGATFYLFNEQGLLIDTLITDENGVATSNLLDYGIYTLKEVEAPEGYSLPDESTRIFVSEHQKTYEITIANEKIPQTGESDIGLIIAISLMSLTGLLAGLLAGAKYFIRRKELI